MKPGVVSGLFLIFVFMANGKKKTVTKTRTATSKTKRVVKANGSVRGKQKETFSDGDKMRRRYMEKPGKKLKTKSVVKSPTGTKSVVKFKETRKGEKTTERIRRGKR